MYRIPELGTFAGPPPAALDRVDKRELRDVLARWGTEPKGQKLDLGAIAAAVNPWAHGKRPKAIDSFAGFGGFSMGAALADIDVIWAVNHWKQAVQMYRENHPGVQAEEENIAVAAWDWRRAPHHQIHIASPSCKGHTVAAGAAYSGANKKLYDALRATARTVLEAAEVHLPDVIVVENVPEFRHWGAKQADGRLYAAWIRTLEAMDYTVTENILNAADSGARCARVRLFVVAVQGGRGIEIPRDTHEHLPVGPVIDWSDELDWRAPRRFDGRWLPLHPRDRAKHKSPLEQWVYDLIDRGAGAGMGRGIIPYFGSTKDKLVPLSVDEPLGSPGTKATFGVYDLTSRVPRYRMLRPIELRDAMGYPDWTKLPMKRDGQVHVTQSNVMLANGVSPLCAAHVFNTIKNQMAGAW